MAGPEDGGRRLTVPFPSQSGPHWCPLILICIAPEEFFCKTIASRTRWNGIRAPPAFLVCSFSPYPLAVLVSTVGLSHLGAAAFSDRRPYMHGQVKRPQGALHSCECLEALGPWALCPSLPWALTHHGPDRVCCWDAGPSQALVSQPGFHSA